MTKAEEKRQEQEEARRWLRKIIGKSRRVYVVLRHVSKSGMWRALDLYVIKNNRPLRITWSVAKFLGYRYDMKHEALGVGGCGMDMGFAVVSSLSAKLYPRRRVKRPEGSRLSRNPAYYLKHEWIG